MLNLDLMLRKCTLALVNSFNIVHLRLYSILAFQERVLVVTLVNEWVFNLGLIVSGVGASCCIQVLGRDLRVLVAQRVLKSMEIHVGAK